MWVIVVGMAVFFLGVLLLLALLSPKGEDRPRVFRCQRCGISFSSPPVQPLPERYREEDLCLCNACSERLEERALEALRRVQGEFLTPSPPIAPDEASK